MRTVKLPPVDECKVLICEMKADDIDSVIAYAKYWVGQMRKRERMETKKVDKSKA